MKPWQFSVKTIGYRIVKGAYWSVLATRASLPAPLVVANPKGEGGAVEGFLVPLSGSGTQEDLARPMERGAYALSSKDRKTVISVTVINPQEAGFSPQPVLDSAYGLSLSAEVRSRIAAAWFLVQFAFESHDPFVHPSLKLLLNSLARLGDLTDGVIADPLALTYKLPGDVFVQDPADDRIDVRDHVSLEILPSMTVTHGLSKFAMPELETASTSRAAQGALLSVAQSLLMGTKLPIGSQLGDSKAPLQLAAGSLQRDGLQRVELIPGSKSTLEGALSFFQRES